jgi:Xaa-Pro aminopeptidase
MSVTITGLSPEGCRDRQHILREYLRSLKLDAALIVDPRHVSSLTGFWSRGIYAPMCLIVREGPTVLAVPFRGEAELAADEVVAYAAASFCTLVDDQPRAALAVLAARLEKCERLGCDGGMRPGLLPRTVLVDR